MTALFRSILAALVLAAGLTAPASAQERPGSLTVTVYDTTGAAIAAANVALTAPDGTVTQQLADEKGSVTFQALVPGRYAFVAEFPGFEPLAVADLNVRAGRNLKQDVTLEIAGFVEQVEVEQDTADRAITESFSQELTASQIDALADDPDEMQQQLEQLAGPGARIRVNGFEGGQLPPKSQIREIRFRFDPFAAENHDAGFPRVDIITKPGNGPIRNNMTFGFRNNALDARNAFSPVRGEGQTRRYGWSIDGPIVKGRTGFSLNVRSNDEYDVQTIVARTPTGAYNSLVTQPAERLSVDFNIEHVLTKTHTLRFSFDRDTNNADNLGIGNFDLESRAYSREGFTNTVRVSDIGSFSKKYLNEIRVQYSWSETESISASSEPTIRVQDQFTSGGAQIAGGRRFWELRFFDSLDIPLGKLHSVRVGADVRTGNYIGDELRNNLGTFTFPTMVAFETNRPNNYTIRQGDPYVEYRNTEAALFVQDDYRFRKNLLLSFGARYEAQSLIDDKANLAPRFGMTWSPFKSNRTTIRAGAGIFYDWYETSLYENTLRQDGTRQFDTIIRNPGYPDPLAGGLIQPVVVPPSVVQMSSDMNMPTVRRYSVGLDQQITGWLRMRANYFNQYGWNQFRSRNLNAPVFGVRPSPELGNIALLETTGEAESHGLDVNLNFNYQPRRLFGVFGYTIGERTNHTDSALSLPVDSNDLEAEWGPAADDIRHRIFSFISTDLKWGLRLGLNYRALSGRPYNITTGLDTNQDGVINERPEGFTRNAGRLPWQSNTDLRLSWSRGFGPQRTPSGPGGGRGGGGGGGPQVVRMGPGGGGGFGGPGGGDNRAVRFEVYLQTFNVFNQVNYSNYAAVVTSALFGQPTAALPARRLEVGFRIGF